MVRNESYYYRKEWLNALIAPQYHNHFGFKGKNYKTYLVGLSFRCQRSHGEEKKLLHLFVMLSRCTQVLFHEEKSNSLINRVINTTKVLSSVGLPIIWDDLATNDSSSSGKAQYT